MRFIKDLDPVRTPRRNDVAYDRRDREFVSYGRIERASARAKHVTTMDAA